MTDAVFIIGHEHANLATVLGHLRRVVTEIAEEGRAPDFALLGTIVDYIQGFPAVMHHPKEEHYLFPALIRRKPDVALMLEMVHNEHVRGAEMLAHLRERLPAYRDDPAQFEPFRRAALDYAEFERRHMAREDRELLPLALKVLHAEDWEPINATFQSNEDPLFGETRRRDFDALFQEITAHGTPDGHEAGATP